MVKLSEAIKDILLGITIERSRSIYPAHTSRQDCIERLGVSQLGRVRPGEVGTRSRVGENTGCHLIVRSNSEQHLGNHLRTCCLSEGVDAQERSAKIKSVSALDEGYVIRHTLRWGIAPRCGTAIIEGAGPIALRTKKRSSCHGVPSPETEESRRKLTREHRRSVAA